MTTAVESLIKVSGVLLELAKPVSLLASILSLLAVFHAAFLGSETDLRHRVMNAMAMLIVATGVSLLSGLTFAETGQDNRRTALGEHSLEKAYVRWTVLQIFESFPMRIFSWGVSSMAFLFVVAWYLQTHCVFYRDIHF